MTTIHIMDRTQRACVLCGKAVTSVADIPQKMMVDPGKWFFFTGGLACATTRTRVQPVCNLEALRVWEIMSS